MIAVIKPGTTKEQLEKLQRWFTSMGLYPQVSTGPLRTVIGLVGDTSRADIGMIESLSVVERVVRITGPSDQIGQHGIPSVVEVGNVKIGDGNFQIIAGPCAVESGPQITDIARHVKAAGATILRGGAFKPRTSPYDFQGLHDRGIELLVEAKKETGMPVVSELTRIEDLPLFEQVDMIQVGARNMQNYELLKELGKTHKPVLLKRGLANTIRELLMSAEYLMAGGNMQIVLCERGIRTFETYTRNTLDLSAVAVLRDLTHLPVIVDPSHATGVARFVEPMAMAAVAAGADGLMIEVHTDPERALSDGAQSLTPDQFARLCKRVQRIREATLEI